MVRLGDIVSISASTQNLDDDQIWLLNLDMVEQQTGNIISYNYVPTDKLGGSIIQFDTENVLYSKLRPNLNKVVIPNRPGFATSEMLPLKPDTDVLTREYLAAYLRSSNFVEWAVSKTAGAKMPRLGTKELLNKDMPVPTIEEQGHITKMLDKVDSLISLRKQQLAKLDELVKARFVEMFGDPVINPFGWEQATLKDVAIGKLTYGSGASSCVYDGNIRYVRITDIDDNGKLNDDIVSPSVVEEKYLLNDGDILFARSGATVGKTYRYHKSDGKCLYAGYLIRLIPDQSQVLPDYIFYYTKTGYYEGFVASNMKVVAQPNINAQQYGDLIICVPPLRKQQDFVVTVQKINRQKLTIQQSLDKLEVLKKSLMQEYFG